MKTIFIESKRRISFDSSKFKEISDKLPKNIAIAYSIQYNGLAEQIKKELSKYHKITAFVQVLGCSKPNFSKSQAVLLVSSGRFHAINLALETGLPIYIVGEGKLEKISDEDISNLKKSQKGAYLKFLNSKNVGILVSLKPGQENLKKAIETKKRLEKKGKKGYLFIANNINTSEFENFDIESWLNTACPRLDMNNSAIISIDKIN